MRFLDARCGILVCPGTPCSPMMSAALQPARQAHDWRGELERNTKTRRLSMQRAFVFVQMALAIMLASPDLRAQAFPSKPVHVIVPSPPGSSLDVFSRALADA